MNTLCVEDAVNSVRFHPEEKNILGYSCENRILKIFDIK